MKSEDIYTQKTRECTKLSKSQYFLIAVFLTQICLASGDNFGAQENIFENGGNLETKKIKNFGAYGDAPCRPRIDFCELCDRDNECTRCDKGMYLDIETIPFACTKCPEKCIGCDLNGCKDC